MNAKKIMGAVLVALLAAALFIGAGAATDAGTVFINQKGAVGPNGVDINGTWTYGTATVIITAGNVSSDNFVEGTYKKGSDTLTIKNPTATITAMGKAGSEEYKVGTLFRGDNLTISATPIANGITVVKELVVTYPNGQQVINVSGAEFWNGTQSDKLPVGQYTVQAVFYANNFTAGTPESALVSAPYTFTVAKSTGDISVAVESVTVGDIIKLSVTGKPGETYEITGFTSQFTNVTGLYPVNKITGGVNISMPNDGVAYINLKAIDDGTATISIKKEGAQSTDKKITIKVNAGEVTIKAEKDSYYLGETVKLSGTITGGLPTDAKFTMKGQNYEGPIQNIDTETDGNSWTAEFETDGADTDAGTYTITLKANGEEASVSVALVQPFISVTDAPAVAVKGSTYKVTGTAEATKKLMVYVFGTNYFAAGQNNINNTKGDKIGTVSVEDDEFTIKLNNLSTMDAGQYFMVIQHPMYDGDFNIAPNLTGAAVSGKIVLDTTGPADAVAATTQNTLFDVADRQKTNAAQALCDELDAQKIDDRYVKLSFVVAAGTSSINPIPSEITQGSKLTVSGQTNTGAGKLVTVEMISTAFAAQPKETVGSASFITLTTKTNDDGSWEITFDTTGLNVDEYTVSAAVEGFDGKTTAKVNVIEGAPTEQPTTQPTETQQPTTQPTETTAPTTPGFGALAALAGLGAVAVLLLRRE